MTFLVIFEVSEMVVVPGLSVLKVAENVPGFPLTVATFVLLLFHVSGSHTLSFVDIL